MPVILSGIRIYKTSWRDKTRRKTYRAHTIAWRDANGRHREKRNTFDAAKKRAEQIAIDIGNGQAHMASFTEAHRATLRRVVELLAPTGKPPELAAAEIADCYKVLGPLADRMSPVEACRFAVANCPANLTHKETPAIVLEMLAAREKDGAAQNTLDDIDSRCTKFAQAFPGPLALITAKQINDWLRALPVSRRTRNNYRGNLVDLYRYAKSAGYIPRTWSPLEDVPRVKNEPVIIRIFTPEEITSLLGHSRPNLIPFIAIAAFAGCRHEEMCAPGRPVLDWRDIDLETKEIHVPAAVARKKGRDRIAPILPNLAEWLTKYQRRNGPICELQNATNALLATAERARVKWKDNGLRKSFISYRLAATRNMSQVAEEAGTSADRIRHNYKKVANEREAKRWFSIAPTTSEILQLNFGL